MIALTVTIVLALNHKKK
ncbi:hypothetical protein [Paenibacillus spongiae]|uniref:Uncharacterized protein n=1 Tax=Paenibacillus spongiae TaxID=2909671 RepID=A0ABY5SJJ0_9BACL|nr:hypothetical protein [Paenibacillus spongiae]UVI33809.1 hypothetical protein L1F29_30500 [Paenibacillus spongiae]